LDRIEAAIVDCRLCPRLVAWRELVAAERRAAFRNEQYWARPVPGFGDPAARLVIVGLAPAAHGGNRTGRVFTGDRSGDFLYAALYRAGYATSPVSVSRDDGLELRGAFITAAVRCAPPQNRPTPEERDTCAPWLVSELQLLVDACVYLVLGGFALDALWRILAAAGLTGSADAPAGAGAPAGRSGRAARPRFAHGLEVPLGGGRSLLCCYHPSQQNTFTGRLTPEMLDAVLARARQLCAGDDVQVPQP
jgi:uracil-DNA glycosylase family 4